MTSIPFQFALLNVKKWRRKTNEIQSENTKSNFWQNYRMQQSVHTYHYSSIDQSPNYQLHHKIRGSLRCYLMLMTDLISIHLTSFAWATKNWALWIVLSNEWNGMFCFFTGAHWRCTSFFNIKYISVECRNFWMPIQFLGEFWCHQT